MTDGFYDVVGRQRAHRRFRSDPVDDAVIERLLWAATRAPSAENAQPWEFVVVTDPDRRAGLADLARRAWEGGARDYERGRLPEGLFADVDHGATSGLATAPVWIVVAADTAKVRDAALGSSIWPATQNLLLAATAEGLGSALTTLSLAYADELAALLDLPDRVRPFAAVPVGYPARGLGPPRRDPVLDHTHTERFGQGSTRERP